MNASTDRPSRRRSLRSIVRIAVAAVTFLFAVQLLSEALQTLSPAISPVFRRQALNGVQLVGAS